MVQVQKFNIQKYQYFSMKQLDYCIKKIMKYVYIIFNMQIVTIILLTLSFQDKQQFWISLLILLKQI